MTAKRKQPALIQTKAIPIDEGGNSGFLKFDPMRHPTSGQPSEILVAYLHRHLRAAGVDVPVLQLIQALAHSPACLLEVLDELLRRAKGG